MSEHFTDLASLTGLQHSLINIVGEKIQEIEIGNIMIDAIAYINIIEPSLSASKNKAPQLQSVPDTLE